MFDRTDPLNGQGKVSSPFGPRNLLFPPGASTNHKGVDIAAGNGTPAYSMCNGGTVLFAGERGNYGNMVDVSCPDGSVVRYAHLDSISVGVGSTVNSTTSIGKVGRTGNSSGDHLHFEIIQNGKNVNPQDCTDIGDNAETGWKCPDGSQPTGAETGGVPECEKTDGSGEKVAAEYQSSDGGDGEMQCDYCSAAPTADDRSWATDVFVLMFRTANNLTTAIYEPVAGQCLKILSAAALLFIVWTLLTAILTSPLPSGGVSKDYFSKLISFLFKVGICAVVLKYGREAFSIFIEPVILVSAEISQKIVESGGNEIVFPNVPISQAPSPDYGSAVSDPFLSEEILQYFLNILQGIYNEVQKGWNLAMTMICVGANPKDSFRIFGIPAFKKYDVMLVMSGALLLASYAALVIFYPIYLMDAFLRMMFVICFFPVFALLWVFKITSEYTKKSFSVLMTGCMTFIFSAVMIKIILTLYAFALDTDGGPLHAFFAACYSSDMNIEKLSELLSETDGFSALISTALVGIVGWFAMQKAEAYAMNFGQSSAMRGVAGQEMQWVTRKALNIPRHIGNRYNEDASQYGDDYYNGRNNRW